MLLLLHGISLVSDSWLTYGVISVKGHAGVSRQSVQITTGYTAVRGKETTKRLITCASGYGEL